MNRILFVCTGNTCRSPMAEGIFRKMAMEDGFKLEIRSAGVSAMDHLPISGHAVHILKLKGIHDAADSNSLTSEAVEWADLILTMTMNHKKHLIEQFPQVIEKAFTLKEYVEDDPEVHNHVKEREHLISELQMKQALSEDISDQERERFLELEGKMPNYDVVDPFGGTMEDYQQCADEIEQCLNQLLKKLKRNK